MNLEKRNERLTQFGSGYMTDAYLLLGCHDEGDGTHVFRVWAPAARAVAVVGDFNGWDKARGGAFHIGGGVWEAVLSGVHTYDCYKYRITRADGTEVLKSDPYGIHTATRPDNASKVYDIGGFSWTDAKYLATRDKKNHFESIDK